MKRMFLPLGLFAIALTFISATKKMGDPPCNEDVYIVDRYVCGDVLVDRVFLNHNSPCTVSVVQVNQEYSLVLPCTHLHPPGGRY